jgi:hypothetical protein
LKAKVWLDELKIFPDALFLSSGIWLRDRAIQGGEPNKIPFIFNDLTIIQGPFGLPVWITAHG